ncbi:MAG: alkaline phosphatase family protein, partial [Acidiferrobacteraceae bacterium]|nr:alkaline phosphatase family protein [Acidiferrobacteraceae bacterium]
MSKLIATSHNIGLILTLVLAATAMPTIASEQPLPRLVLQITIDQLRGDLPRRYYERLGEGGF